MASVARSRADGEGQMVPRTLARGTPGADAYRFCVNWNGMLEPLELPKGCTVAQLLSVLKVSPAPAPTPRTAPLAHACS